MKKLKKIKKKSFFNLLIKNYVLFTITNAIIVCAMFFIGILITDKFLGFPYGHPKNQLDILEKGNYTELNIKDLVGKNGSIQILDKNNKVIYKSNKKKEQIASYTNNELKYIPEYDEYESSIHLKTYKDKNNKKFTIISKNKYTDDLDKNYDSNEGWFEILDENLNVVYSGGNLESNKTSYTKKEFDYLTGNISKKYYISKYQFEDKDKNKYTMILKISKLSEDKIATILDKSLMITFVIFLIIYTISTALFVMWLNWKVKKPLEKLNKAMISLSEGGTYESIEYKGSHEFMQICENFNAMSQKLNKSKEENEHLQSEKQKMLADISHDLKTPITIIQGYAKALSDGIISKDDQEKYLKIIYEKSNNLTELINVFHEYSKLEHIDFKLNLEQKDLSEFIRAYVAHKYEYIYDINFNMEVEIPEHKLLCYFDEVQLKRAFENIISNSIKHNKEGTTICIILEEELNDYKITIGDDGIGIPEDIINSIFDAFVVGDDSRNTKQGSGLGLAITKKIVEKHNGNIKLISDLNSEFKTIFEIRIPKK